MLPSQVIDQLVQVVGAPNVLTKESDRVVYECDAFTVERFLPAAVVLPGSTEEVQRVVQILSAHGIPFLPRGAGTGLSGGATPLQNSVVIPLTRMDRILAVDFRNRLALVEAGVINLKLGQVAQKRGYHFAPDPSSQGAATIGGNIAENAGGPHTLKYGVTANHVEALELVLPDGTVMWTSARAPSHDGAYDIAGLLCGAEGTMGIVTRAIVRLIRLAPSLRTLLAAFRTVDDATQCVSAIIAQGIIPSALEMMDRATIQAVEEAFQLGLPTDADAILVIELDQLEAGIDEDIRRIEEICLAHRSRKISMAQTAEERAQLWQARRLAVAAMGRLAPSYVIQDGVVPRTKLPHILRHVARVSAEYDIPIANVMHAGDGNIHPILLFDERDPEQVRRVLAASGEILAECMRLGGTVTGEHGIGIEKAKFLPRMFSEDDLKLMDDVRSVFDPRGLCNPGKVFPAGTTAGDDLSAEAQEEASAS